MYISSFCYILMEHFPKLSDKLNVPVPSHLLEIFFNFKICTSLAPLQLSDDTKKLICSHFHKRLNNSYLHFKEIKCKIAKKCKI